MRNAHRPLGLPPAAVLLLLIAGCAASGPPAVLPEPEPVAVAPAPLPTPPVAPEPVAAPATTPAPARAEIALILDTSAPTHAAVADEIAAALPPRRYRVTRFTSDAAPELAALRDRQVTLIAVGTQAVQAARSALPDKPLVFCQVPGHAEALQAGAPVW